MFGAFGKAMPTTCWTFTSQAALNGGLKERLCLERNLLAVKGTRRLTKEHMVLNGATPTIEVDPEHFTVRVDGKEIALSPAETISLAQLYWFS
jgi:urease subunit alpha